MLEHVTLVPLPPFGFRKKLRGVLSTGTAGVDQFCPVGNTNLINALAITSSYRGYNELHRLKSEKRRSHYPLCAFYPGQ